MIVGLGDPKKVSETLWQFVFYFVLCKKMHWGEKMQFGGGVVVGGD